MKVTHYLGDDMLTDNNIDCQQESNLDCYDVKIFKIINIMLDKAIPFNDNWKC